jgi:2-polyprenyl-3-methyl-5-hydroxy-6-metoxy-1,4-benzoquinol methylase
MNKEFNSSHYTVPIVLNEFSEDRLNAIFKMIGSGKEVLDLGCWDGSISELIKNKGNQVEGIEISDYSLQKARAKGFTVYDLDLNSRWSEGVPKKYDAVFGGEVIEHIFETDIFLEEIYKVLKDDGFLVLSTPNLAAFGRRLLLLLGLNPLTELTTRNNEAGHLRYFVHGTLKKLLLEHKFEITEFTSDVVNLEPKGLIRSSRLAKMFPAFGRSLIVKAKKIS